MNYTFHNAQKLYNQTKSLQSGLQPILTDYLSVQNDVILILREGADSAQTAHTINIFSEINRIQLSNTKKLKNLFINLNKISDLLANSKMINKFLDFKSLSKSVDYNKVIDPEFIEVHNHLWENIKNSSIPVWQYNIAICRIYVYYIFYSDFVILQTFLNRPNIQERIFESVIELAKVVGKELLDYAMPFFNSIVETIVTISKTHLAKEQEKIKSAITVFDKLIIFRDHLSTLSNYLTSAEIVVNTSESLLIENESKFVKEADFLLEMWRSIQKD